MESSREKSSSTVEFAVEMKCGSCANQVRSALDRVPGVEVLDIDVGKQSVMVRTSVPAMEVQNLIENTGRRAILRGLGAPGAHLGAAVVEFYGQNGVKGVTRFVQLAQDLCVIDGTIDGLAPGKHGFAVCQSGDLSQGCESVGEHYNPTRAPHGFPGSPESHMGDLGNICADTNGRASFRLENNRLKVWDVIGRALAVHAREDDSGRGSTDRSRIDGNSGDKIACGIIARSAGIMENTKKICSCSGATLWEERDEAKSRSQ